MNEFKPITEKTHPIEKRWVIKNVIILSPLIDFFIALLFSGGEEHFNQVIFISILVIGIIVIPPLLYLYLKLIIKNYHYWFDERLITLNQGIISKSQRQLLYGRIQNIHLSQSIINRLLGLASISIETASEGAGAKFILKTKENKPDLSLAILGFASNRIGIPGLSYENAVDLKNRLMELIKMNPIDDAQSGL